MRSRIVIESIDVEIKFYINTILKTIKSLGILYHIFLLPKRIKKITLLKSPHVNKKAREQFQIVKKKCILDLDCEIDEKIAKCILLNKPKQIKIRLRKII